MKNSISGHPYAEMQLILKERKALEERPLALKLPEYRSRLDLSIYPEHCFYALNYIYAVFSFKKSLIKK